MALPAILASLMFKQIVASTVVGAATGTVGCFKAKSAQSIKERANRHLTSAENQFQVWCEAFFNEAEYTGQEFERIHRETINKFIDICRLEGISVNQQEKQILKSVEIESRIFLTKTIRESSNLKNIFLPLIGGAAFAAQAAAVGRQMALSLVVLFGTDVAAGEAFVFFSAELGVISTSAALSLPMIAMNAVSGAVLAGGIALLVQGLEAENKAQKFESDVDKKIEDLDKAQRRLLAVDKRLKEVRRLASELERRASKSLDYLEKDFNPQSFHQTLLLITSLSKVTTMPIIEHGELNTEFVRFKVNYQTI